MKNQPNRHGRRLPEAPAAEGDGQQQGPQQVKGGEEGQQQGNRGQDGQDRRVPQDDQGLAGPLIGVEGQVEEVPKVR